MNFYLNKYGFCKPQIQNKPCKELELVVVIPCFNEPDLISSIQSLADCAKINGVVEVIVVVNHSENASKHVIEQNNDTVELYNQFIKNQEYEGIIFELIYAKNLPQKHAGVGLARKIGMDEAVARFEALSKDGIIVCFDADSDCAKNYLKSIQDHFLKYSKSPGCSVYFEHPTTGSEFPLNVYNGIIFYELHLRYYNQSLKYAGLPYAFHTVGSSMAVRSSAYQKQGGMNKRKAGEDFYFIHKIIGLGNFSEIKNTCVIPSPRISDRVPFGTGKAVGDWVESNKLQFDTYNFRIFTEIKKFVEQIEVIYEQEFFLSEIIIHDSLKKFLVENKVEKSIQEVKNNTTSSKAFEKRFFAWFDAFRVLKLVHYMRDNGFPNNDVAEESKNLLELFAKLELDNSNSSELLFQFRSIERGDA